MDGIRSINLPYCKSKNLYVLKYLSKGKVLSVSYFLVLLLEKDNIMKFEYEDHPGQ